ncbi:MAG: hypothetical protein IPO90_03290 [Flavobacteriales bacterium]|nr:hypothetical protein [Flavobacteriales bacterium]MBL0046113.1 hypothetical protein [Flavobacteriales bacterium]
MKLAIRIAAITGGIMLATASIAQDQVIGSPKPAPTAATSAVAPRINDGFKGINIGLLIKRVEISTEQTQQVKDLNSNYYKAHNAMAADMPLEERKAKVISMMAEREVELKKILTPEQQVKYAEMSVAPTPSEKPLGGVVPAPSPKKMEGKK